MIGYVKKKKEPKLCAICGSEFLPDKPTYKTCSDECSKELERRRQKKRSARKYQRKKAGIKPRQRRKQVNDFFPYDSISISI